MSSHRNYLDPILMGKYTVENFFSHSFLGWPVWVLLANNCLLKVTYHTFNHIPENILYYVLVKIKSFSIFIVGNLLYNPPKKVFQKAHFSVYFLSSPFSVFVTRNRYDVRRD